MEGIFQVAAEHINHPIQRCGSWRPVFHDFIIVAETKLNRGMPQGYAGNSVGNVAHFRADGL